MSTDTASGVRGNAQTAPGGSRIPGWAGPVALLTLSAFFVGVVIWGFLNPADVRVEYYDAGRADSFEIGRVTAFPDMDLYVVGMPDGRLRAIDGRIDGTDCVVRWLPDDARGSAYNSSGAPGVFEDPCTGATWSMEANAISGTVKPLRTPYIDYRPGATEFNLHAFVERVNP
ncbi:MAG: hypothetical protein WEA81_00840 [Dehalococcoidia bacterium]